jgi:GNAT superfamily N-acetyltransferase
MDVRRAGAADVGRVVEILEEAAAWQRSRGIRQWPSRFPPEDVARRMRMCDWYLAWDGPEAVGTFTLQPSDPVVWGERPADALYLHHLAVRRTHAGLGRQLLTFAERTTLEAGRRYLRLDCMAANPELRAYYERAGFRHAGEWRGGGWTASLYEKPVGHVD